MRKKKTGLISVCICSMIFLSFAMLIIGMWLKDQYHYVRLAGISVTVEATITSVEEDYDSESGTEYDAYISYEFDGKTYSDIYYDSFTWEPKLGKTVSVEIDPQNPAFLRPDKPGVGWLVFISIIFFIPGLFILVIGVSDAVGLKKAAEQWKDIYRSSYLNSAMVQKDILYEYKTADRVRLIMTGCLAVIFTAICCFCYFQYGLGIAFLPFFFSLAPVLYVVINAHFGMQKLQITMRSDVIEEENKEEDEDTVTYYFVFERFGKWKHSPDIFVDVKQTAFYDLRAGSQVIIAVDNRNHILRLFSKKDYQIIEG